MRPPPQPQGNPGPVQRSFPQLLDVTVKLPSKTTGTNKSRSSNLNKCETTNEATFIRPLRHLPYIPHQKKKEGFSWEEKAFTSLRKDFGKTLAKPQRFSVACLVFLRNHREALTPADLLSCQQKKKNMIGSLWNFHRVDISIFSWWSTQRDMK